MSTSETGMDSPAPQDTAQAFERATSSNVVIKNMPHSAKMASRNKFAMNLSWWALKNVTLACCSRQLAGAHLSMSIAGCRAVNILLFIAKVVAFALSRSFSVLASAADSFVDLSSQVQVWHCYLSSWGPAPEFIASLRAPPAGCACTSDLAHAQGGPQIPHRKDSPGDSCRDHLCRWVSKKSTASMWSVVYCVSIPKGEPTSCSCVAVIMSIATVEVIHEAIQALVDGLAHGESKDHAVLCSC